MNIETILQTFIDEVNDEYYVDYYVENIPEFVLDVTDLIELPLCPSELKQQYIRVW